MSKIQVFIFFCLILPLGVSGQKLKQTVIMGDLAFERFRYNDAVELYKSALDDNKEDLEVKLKIAESYRKMNDHTNSIGWYSQVLDSTDSNYEDIYKLHYAQALLYKGDKENAKKWFLEYRKGDGTHEVAKNRVEGIENFETFLINSDRYTINKLDINSPSRDFSPAYFDDGIIFVSDRKKSHGKNDWDDRVFLNLFYSKLSENGSFYPPEELSNKLNTLYHEGPVSVYKEEKNIVFTRNNYHKKKVKRSEDGVNHLQLFFADISENGQWKNLKPFQHNSAEFSTGHPSMNSKGDLLIFSSDRPGGMGGSDLYSTQLVGDQWSQPVNLGAVINTQGDDLFPFLYQDSILYFSSNGHHGLGGLDVYKSSIGKGNVARIENMGIPINSNVDDFGLIMNEFGTKGFFSSNRESYENDDIYKFNIIPFGVDIKFVDGQTKQQVIVSQLRIINPKGNQHPYESFAMAFRFSSKKGDQYRLEYLADGYQYKEVSFSTIDMKPGELLKVDVSLDKQQEVIDVPIELVEVGDNVFFGIDGQLFTPFDLGVPIKPDEDIHTQLVEKGYDISKPLEIKNIYYDNDGKELRQESVHTIENILYIMNKYKGTSLVIGSHTDSNGSLLYNNKLSARRSKTVYDNLVLHKLDNKRISVKSYGELFPVNDCRDGEICTDDQYQLNRRTEFNLNF